jgi:NADH dehydrogenase [ubiquinone] 1 alpha subcomplex assembly factor 7
MTPLAEILADQIGATGPITVAEYMTACLHHPRHGYYATRDPLGAAGDFTTAPEISQMFGEIVGLALAQSWRDRGAPSPFALVELGPGRGTLIADLLRATAKVPGFHAAMRLVLVESAPHFRARQRQVLGEMRATWVDGVPDLPDLPLFLVANEFFDALPVRQFLRDGPAWRERMVGVRDGRLAFALADPARPARLEPRLADTVEGDMVETNAPAEALAAEIGARIAHRGGLALVVDYGGGASKGDTFQAVRGHRKEDPLASPGEADLTAHLDFAALAAAAAPAAASALTPQGVWLERLGITARGRMLAAALSGPAFDDHVAAHRRLTHPAEMGDLFKVMSLHDGAGPAPGLERAG